MRGFKFPKDYENTSTDNDSICLTNDESDEDGDVGGDSAIPSQSTDATAALTLRETVDSQSSPVIEGEESGPPLEVVKAADSASEFVVEEGATIAVPPEDVLEVDALSVDLPNVEIEEVVVSVCLNVCVRVFAF